MSRTRTATASGSPLLARNVRSVLANTDFLGEVIAWRAWRVIGSEQLPMLSSVSVRACIWHPNRWTTAECRARGSALGRCPNPGGDGRIPSESCTCGLHAARDREQLMHLGYNRQGDRPVFIGQVGFAGKVIAGTQGWRAEKARIVRLFVPFEHYRYVRPLEALYRVPVVLDNTSPRRPRSTSLSTAQEPTDGHWQGIPLFVIEPVQDPFEQPAPAPAPEPRETPAPERETVPGRAREAAGMSSEGPTRNVQASGGLELVAPAVFGFV